MKEVIVKRPGLVNGPEDRTITGDLESMQEIVGGYIELVRLPGLEEHGIDLYVNEEGKLNGLQANFLIYEGRDLVVGTVFFVGADEETGETVSLTAKQKKIVRKFLDTVPMGVF